MGREMKGKDCPLRVKRKEREGKEKERRQWKRGRAGSST